MPGPLIRASHTISPLTFTIFLSDILFLFYRSFGVNSSHLLSVVEMLRCSVLCPLRLLDIHSTICKIPVDGVLPSRWHFGMVSLENCVPTSSTPHSFILIFLGPTTLLKAWHLSQENRITKLLCVAQRSGKGTEPLKTTTFKECDLLVLVATKQFIVL